MDPNKNPVPTGTTDRLTQQYPIRGPITASAHLPPPTVLRRRLESGPQIPVPSRSPARVCRLRQAPCPAISDEAAGAAKITRRQGARRKSCAAAGGAEGVVPTPDRRFLWLGLRYLPRSASIQTPSARSASRCRSVASASRVRADSTSTILLAVRQADSCSPACITSQGR